MCNKPYCVHALTDTGTPKGKIIYCSFYAQGAKQLPVNCMIPHLCDDDEVIELTDEIDEPVFLGSIS